MRRVRTRIVLTAAAAALAVPGIASADPLTKPEKKAVDIKAADGASTDDAALVETSFKGNFGRLMGTAGLKKARISYEFLTADGASTTITDRGAGRRAKETRTGSTGKFEVVRDKRGAYVLVENLPDATTRVIIEVLAPKGTGGGGAKPRAVTLEELGKELTRLDNRESIGFARERALDGLEDAREALERAEKQADKTIDQISDAQEALVNAKSGAAAKEAREDLVRLKEKLKTLNQVRKDARAEISVWERWLELIELASIGARPICSDSLDNDNDGATDLTDPGCKNELDNDEKDEDAQVPCPVDGASNQTSLTINTPLANTLLAFDLTRSPSNQAILTQQVTAPSGGPTPVPGNLCGIGINVLYSYQVYDGTNPPPGFSPPPPGDFAITIFIDATNPPGGSNPGGVDNGVRLALDTRAP